MTQDMKPAVKHDTERNRFSVTVENHLCLLDYKLAESVMTITHTLVPPELGGRGIAAELTKVALQYARDNHWRVVPQCSYAAVYIKRHAEYADLLQ